MIALVAAAVLALVALVVTALSRKRAPQVASPAALPALSAVEDESLEALAARLAERAMVSSQASGVAVHRIEHLANRELAAVGEATETRTVLLEEVVHAKKPLTVGRVTIVPVVHRDRVEALIVACGAADPAHVASLAAEAAPLFAEVADEAMRSTNRMIALAQSSDLDEVFEALADGVAVTDQRGNVVRVNAAGRAILEKAAQSHSGEGNPLREALRDGSPTPNLEVAFGTDDGGCVVQVKISKLSRAESSRAAVAIFRDTTRERTLEHELRKESRERQKHLEELENKTNELQRATRHKSEFLANMSHELRTPLNAILGFTEILLDGTYGSLNDKQSGCARDVLDGGRQLLNLINDILDLSKIEAGKVELAREDATVEGILRNALTLVRVQASQKNIAVALEVPATLMARADCDRIRQVMLNLLSNAVKFTPAGGKVTVQAREAGSFVRISVVDTGVGIAAADAGKLFKDFSQVDGSVTRRFGGTGLGLAICKKLVELHGGTIGFESELGKGSCFWFEIPRAVRSERPPFVHAPVLRASSQVPVSRNSHVRTALVVDADDASRRIAARSLRDAGIAPLVCATLTEARGIATRCSPEAIVIDPALPDANDMEAIQFAVERSGTAVVVTSTRTSSELATTLPSGVAFVQKPLDRAVLAERVRKAVARGNADTRTALVVESAEDGPAICALLESEGFRAELVTSMREARRTLPTLRPKMIVLELDLDDGDGLELLRTLAPDTQLVKIVLTARTLDATTSAELSRLTRLVVQKGTLSRTSFARRIEAALQAESALRPRILAVDDNDQNLRLVAAVLGGHYEVIEARDAATAIDFAQRENPDLILMDVMLPDIDGLSATRTLRGDPRTRAIPVIAISANAMPEDHEKARAAGCCAYVTKPVDARHLLEVVREALRFDGDPLPAPRQPSGRHAAGRTPQSMPDEVPSYRAGERA